MKWDEITEKSVWEYIDNVIYIINKTNTMITFCFYDASEDRFYTQMRIRKSVAAGAHWRQYKETGNKNKIIICMFSAAEVIDELYD